MGRFMGALIFFLVLQTLAASGRLYIRAAIVRKIGPDDVALVFTWLFSTAFIACGIAVHTTTGNQSIIKIPLQVLFPALNTILASELCYVAGAACLKVALGLLLLRVLVRKWQIYVIYATLALALSYSISFFFVVLFQCGDPSRFIMRYLTNSCLRPDVVSGLSYTHAVITAGTDWVFAIVPIFFLVHTNLSLRSKLSVGGILALGSVGSILTLIRIGWIHFLTVPTTNFLVTAQGIAVLSAAELSIGITCASLATYKPLFRRYFSSSTNPDPESQHLGRLAPNQEKTCSSPRTIDVAPDGTENRWSDPTAAALSDDDEEEWNRGTFVSPCSSPTFGRRPATKREF